MTTPTSNKPGGRWAGFGFTLLLALIPVPFGILLFISSVAGGKEPVLVFCFVNALCSLMAGYRLGRMFPEIKLINHIFLTVFSGVILFAVDWVTVVASIILFCFPGGIC